MPNRCLGKG